MSHLDHGTLLSCHLCFSDIVPSCGNLGSVNSNTSLNSEKMRCPSLFCLFPASILESAISPEDPDFLMKKGIRLRTWALMCLWLWGTHFF